MAPDRSIPMLLHAGGKVSQQGMTTGQSWLQTCGAIQRPPARSTLTPKHSAAR